MTLFGGMSFLHRMHRLSARLIDCLPPWSDWQDVSQIDRLAISYGSTTIIGVLGTVSGFYTHYENVGILQAQASIQLWKVLELHAQKGSTESARLLAQGEDLGSECLDKSSRTSSFVMALTGSSIS